jgi:hypothetical protein
MPRIRVPEDNVTARSGAAVQGVDMRADMPACSRTALLMLAFCAAVTGCANYQPPPVFAGFLSPLVARTGCIDAVAREFKVPKDNVKPLGDTGTMQDGIYVITLSIGAGQPNINCTVNENGNVSDVIRAR